MEQRVAGAGQEDDRVLPDIEFLHPGLARTERVAHVDSGEADQDDAEGQPHDHAAYRLVHRIDDADHDR
jgi:hypothetical protein